MIELYRMKSRPKGLLADCNLEHDSEQFDYIKELHEVLWRFVRAELPGAGGDLSDFIPVALYLAERHGSHLLQRKQNDDQSNL